MGKLKIKQEKSGKASKRKSVELFKKRVFPDIIRSY